MALSDNIKKAREKQGFSQEYIADKLNVSRQAVSKWETGQSEPSTQNLLQLAEVLKVDANILLNESRERKVFAKENSDDEWSRFCDSIAKGSVWLTEEGFYSFSGYGDGCYGVYAQKSDNEIVALEIRFI